MAKNKGKTGLALKIIVAVALVAVVAVAVVGSQGGWFQGRLFGAQKFVTTQQRTVDFGQRSDTIRLEGIKQQLGKLEYRIIQPNYADLAIGDVDQQLLQVRFENQTLNNFRIREFQFLVAGDGLNNFSIGPNYLLLNGITYIQDNAKYQDGIWWDRVTVDLINPYTFSSGDVKIFELIADVVGESGSNVKVNFEKILTEEDVSLVQVLPFTPIVRDIQ